MSDLGDAGGEVLGLFIGVPVAIICVLVLPFVAIQKGCEHFTEKKPKVEQTSKVYIEPKKESLSFRAGQKTKESTKDFFRGVFSKKKEQ